MMDDSGKFYKKLIPDFEWSIPNVVSVLSHTTATVEKSHEFCDGNWILEIDRNLFTIRFCMRKERSAGQPIFSNVVTKNNHRTFISFKWYVVKENGMESLLGEYDFHMNSILTDCYEIGRKIIIAEKKDVWHKLQQTDSLKIISKFRCLDCPVKLTYVPILSNQSHGTLKRKQPEEEIVEFVDSKKKMLCPSGVNTLLRDIKNLLTTGEGSDVTIKVKDSEFRAHKNILRARSPVFFKMFIYDMYEKKNGIIDIDDCKPEAFQKFLNYLYTGKLDDVSMDIVCNLYYIGDKYEVEEVKKICIISMSRYLSVDTFCEIFTLAHLYKETIILEAASEFFIRNLKAIISTDQWLSFLREQPVIANELHIKAADR